MKYDIYKRINCPQDEARQVTVCSLNSQIFSRIKEPCTDRFTMRAPKGEGIFPISKLSEGRKIHVLPCNVDYPDSLSQCSLSLRNAWSSRFLSARHIAQNRKRSKHFSTKTHRNTHDEGKRSETHLALRIGAFMVNRCAVLWCGRDLWIETAHTVNCLASH